MTVLENGDSEGMEQLRMFGEIENFVLKNVVSLKDDDVARSGNVLKVYPTAHIKNAVISDVYAVGATKVISGEEHIDRLHQSNVFAQ